LVDDSWVGPYDSLDPQYGFFTVDGYFSNVFQGLVAYNGTDSNHVIPSIAANWTISSDYKHFTFTIRQGVTFSNGDPVNAYTMWFSFQRGYVLNAPTGDYISNYPNILQNVSNPCTGSLSSPTSCVGQEGGAPGAPINALIWGTANAVANTYGVSATNENAVIQDLLNVMDNFNPTTNTTQAALTEYPNQGVQVVNEYTFQINLIQPYPSLLIILPPQWGSAVDPIWVDSAAGCGGVVNNTACTNFGTKGGPGTGPYEYGVIGPSNSQVVLNANPRYWAKSYNWSNGTPSALCFPAGAVCQEALKPPSIPTIIMNFGVEETTVIGDFDTNAAQMAVIGVPHFSEMINSFDVTSDRSYNTLVHNAGYPLCDLATGLNGQVAPTNNVDFRQFMVHSINYSEYISQVYSYNGISLAQLFLPPVPPGWGPLDNPSNIPLYSYNLTLAANYLNESLWAEGYHVVTVEDVTNAAGQVTVPAGTTLGNPSDPTLPPVLYQYIVPLTPEVETLNEITAAGPAILGVNLNFQGITTAQYDLESAGSIEGNFGGLPPMVGVGWCADFPDPMYQMFAPMVVAGIAGEASASVSNSTLDALTLRIPFESPAQALVDSKTVWAMFAQLAGIAQLPNSATLYFAQPYLQNIVWSPFQFGYYYNMMTYS
jgi:ABC-type transport system substrate-binding protein